MCRGSPSRDISSETEVRQSLCSQKSLEKDTPIVTILKIVKRKKEVVKIVKGGAGWEALDHRPFLGSALGGHFETLLLHSSS